jgi:SET domain-containing protein
VPYELRTSSIAGKGIFATAPIARGTRVWRYEIGVNVVFYKDELELRKRLIGLSKEEAVYLLEHLYAYGGVVIEILDDDKMTNHAADRNTGHHEDGETYINTYALRDIAAGEELVEDYATYETIDWFESISKEHAAISCVTIGHTYREPRFLSSP